MNTDTASSGTIRLVLGDQLSDTLSALDGVDRRNDIVLMVEVNDEATYVRHHKQKIALIFAAMRCPGRCSRRRRSAALSFRVNWPVAPQ